MTEEETERESENSCIDEVTHAERMRESYQEELQDINKFFDEFHQLSDFMMAYLKKKYGYLVCDFENFLWILDTNRFVQKTEETEKLFQEATTIAFDKYNTCIKQDLNRIENKLNILVNQKNIHLLERFLQRLLIKFPQIIEPELKFIEEEYNLGNTLYRGDLLFRDGKNTLLYIELKVVIPSYNKFERQMKRYLSHISEGNRIMYIAPGVTPEQERFCNDNNIEIKIINLDELFD